MTIEKQIELITAERDERLLKGFSIERQQDKIDGLSNCLKGVHSATRAIGLSLGGGSTAVYHKCRYCDERV